MRSVRGPSARPRTNSVSVGASGGPRPRNRRTNPGSSSSSSAAAARLRSTTSVSSSSTSTPAPRLPRTVSRNERRDASCLRLWFSASVMRLNDRTSWPISSPPLSGTRRSSSPRAMRSVAATRLRIGPTIRPDRASPAPTANTRASELSPKTNICPRRRSRASSVARANNRADNTPRCGVPGPGEHGVPLGHGQTAVLFGFDHAPRGPSEHRQRRCVEHRRTQPGPVQRRLAADHGPRSVVERQIGADRPRDAVEILVAQSPPHVHGVRTVVGPEHGIAPDRGTIRRHRLRA